MPRDGSGGYTLPSGNPVVFGTTIEPVWANATMEDVRVALANSVAKDGQTVMTGALNVGGFRVLGLALGLAATPAISFTGDAGTGLWSPGTGQVALSNNGVQSLSISANRNVTIAAPVSGIPLTVNGVSGADAAAFNTNESTFRYVTFTNAHASGSGGFAVSVGTGGTPVQGVLYGSAGVGMGLRAISNHPLLLGTNNIDRISIQAAGRVDVISNHTTAYLNITDAAGTDRSLLGFASGVGLRIWNKDSSDLSLGANNAAALIINGATRAVHINAPVSGAALNVTAFATANAVSLTVAAGSNTGQIISDGTRQLNLTVGSGYSGGVAWGAGTNHAASIITNNLERVAIAAAGNVTIAAPSSGTTLTLAGTNALTFTATSAEIICPPTSLVFRNNADSANNFSINDGGGAVCNGNLNITAGGATITGNTTVSGSFTAGGYITAVPSASYAATLTTAHRGQCMQATGNVTVPNSTFAAGDSISVYNNTGADITITQGASFTLRQVGTANIGNRTLATRGLCTIWFISATEGVINGGGLT